MTSEQWTQQIKTQAMELGFDLIQITDTRDHPQALSSLKTWIKKDAHASMGYMEQNSSRRASPCTSHPDATSMILLGMNHQVFKQDTLNSSGMRIAAYALAPDYHRVIRTKLDILQQSLQSSAVDATSWGFVDTAPILERAFAERAGLGFVGKNTMLINKSLGSWFFIAGILTNLPLVRDEPSFHGSCGTCRICLDACPTGALEEPFFLNSNKCIAYLTIEHKGPVNPSLRPLMQNWLFGCDICQDVCPHNRSKTKQARPAQRKAVEIEDLANISSNRLFKRRFQDSPLERPGRKGLLRNACIVMGNSRSPQWMPILTQLLIEEGRADIREAAAWALGQIESDQKISILKDALKKEEDKTVQETLRKGIAAYPQATGHQ